MSLNSALGIFHIKNKYILFFITTFADITDEYHPKLKLYLAASGNAEIKYQLHAIFAELVQELKCKPAIYW